MNNYIVTSTWQ